LRPWLYLKIDPSLSLHPPVPFRKVSSKTPKLESYQVDGLLYYRLKISRLPAYHDLLKLGKQRNGSIFLDIGSCCESTPAHLSNPEQIQMSIILVGNDARKVVADGFPLENVVTSDLHQGLCHIIVSQ
jgi:hypothetical protein